MKFHVKQGIILIIFGVIWAVVMNILGMILFFLWPIVSILNLVPLVLTIIGIINALNRKENELPVIGAYAKNLKF